MPSKLKWFESGKRASEHIITKLLMKKLRLFAHFPTLLFDKDQQSCSKK
jgi:hypothetical protein